MAKSPHPLVPGFREHVVEVLCRTEFKFSGQVLNKFNRLSMKTFSEDWLITNGGGVAHDFLDR